MQTIQFEYQVNNDVYENFLQSGQEIKDKVKEFLLFELNMFDDNSLTIGTEEAKRRVTEAVEEYHSGKGTYLSEDEYANRMDSFMEKLESKYGNN